MPDRRPFGLLFAFQTYISQICIHTFGLPKKVLIVLRWAIVTPWVSCFMHVRSSLCVVSLLQFFRELCPFFNLEYWICAIFHTFLLHALTYWGEILFASLLIINDRLSLSGINYCWLLWKLFLLLNCVWVMSLQY